MFIIYLDFGYDGFQIEGVADSLGIACELLIAKMVGLKGEVYSKDEIVIEEFTNNCLSEGVSRLTLDTGYILYDKEHVTRGNADLLPSSVKGLVRAYINNIGLSATPDLLEILEGYNVRDLDQI